MSGIKTILDAVMPQENAASHREARTRARAAAHAGGWLSLILDHHQHIESAFAITTSATTVAEQRQAQKRLALLLTAHANAEESAIYPAMSRSARPHDATTAYAEQATLKLEMAALELLEPLSEAYLQRLDIIRDSVAHHVYEEESQWFLALKENLTPDDEQRIGLRYAEEFSRYLGRDAALATAPASRHAGSATSLGQPL
ncbi:MAG TPA: hemerythrin domain-containing protein [Steroidobacteraceae bacterium]|nr:hemerythrin domain-containing protein [Steroidobacteraceae bacterium]